MIAELYPQAGQHLTAARDVKATMARTWGSYLDAGLNHVEVFNYSDGRGRITVHANWPTGAREKITNLFKACTSELWACLDSLVSDSVAMFSILKRPRAPRSPPPPRKCRRAGALVAGPPSPENPGNPGVPATV
jgi:hypothetical protein